MPEYVVKPVAGDPAGVNAFGGTIDFAGRQAIVRADDATEARVIGAKRLGVAEGDVTVEAIQL